jgi:biotin synthase
MNLIKQLQSNRDLSDEQLITLMQTDSYDNELYTSAVAIRERYYGRAVYIRGLIELSNYCKNDCFYCGIRRSNNEASRYRLTESEILDCCANGYELGFRTFVLQGGEDPYFSDEVMESLIYKIKKGYPDCAITLSLGERSRESYERMFEAGADRYLLRHETASEEHYKKLHPEEMKLSNRKKCLFDLKEIGYQVGAGFMVGSPYQDYECLLEDLRFLQKLEPDMIGIGPFISHRDTPFSNFSNGDLKLTLRMLAILRHLFPSVLLPATTALGTAHPQGREMGLLAGGNVVMPNLSPVAVRAKYELYDDKICTGEEAAECRNCLEGRVMSTGCQIVVDRGDKRSDVLDLGGDKL